MILVTVNKCMKSCNTRVCANVTVIRGHIIFMEDVRVYKGHVYYERIKFV